MMPLTSQEEAVKRLLTEQRMSFEAHHVFDLKERGRISVDFLVFLDAGLVIECTSCSTRKGRALSELRRRAAYMDYQVRIAEGVVPKACLWSVGRRPPGRIRNASQASSSRFSGIQTLWPGPTMNFEVRCVRTAEAITDGILRLETGGRIF